MNARLPAVLRRKKLSWICLLCSLVVLSGCRLNPEAAGRIAATRLALMPTETPAPPPPFLALCLVKATARQNMRAAPIASADVVGTLANRAVLSVTLRSADAAWVYGMNAVNVTGWVTAASVACTVPVEELVVPTPTLGPTTPTASVELTTTQPSTALTASPTPLVLVSTATEAPTATPADTATPAATDTPLPPTATATPAIAPELQCSVLITRGLNVRRGPGTNFAAFYRLDQGETFAAVGRSEDGRWLGGRIVATNQGGWLISSSVSCDGSIDTLATLTNNELPLSEAVTPTPTPTQTPKATTTESPTPTPTQTPSAEVTVTPTQAAEPTALATLSPTVVAIAPTLEPTATPVATVPAASATLACTVASPTGVYVRSGPSRAFEAFGVAKLGETFAATRRTANNEWLLGTSQGGLVGWVVAGGMNCATPLRNVPVIDPAIAQTPLPPQN